MAKRISTEENLLAIGELERLPVTEGTRKKLGKTLTSLNSLLVAKAAEVVARLWMTEMIPDLLKAFDRFLENPLKRDKGCLAKEAVIDALDNLDYREKGIFLQGIKYFQIEPAYLRPVDTAAALRGKCGFALVRMGYPGVAFELVDLLADPEPDARLAAVKALAGLPSEISEPLLRLKARLGDDEGQVRAECLFALMQVNPVNSMGFVETFLAAENSMVMNPSDMILAENAALALGESRLEEAFEILKRHRKNSMNVDFQDMLLTPMAITRLEEAFNYLIDLIENGCRQSAVKAAGALQIFGDESHRARIQSAVESRDDTAVSEAFASWNY